MYVESLRTLKYYQCCEYYHMLPAARHVPGTILLYSYILCVIFIILLEEGITLRIVQKEQYGLREFMPLTEGQIINKWQNQIQNLFHSSRFFFFLMLNLKFLIKICEMAMLFIKLYIIHSSIFQLFAKSCIICSSKLHFQKQYVQKFLYLF